MSVRTDTDAPRMSDATLARHASLCERPERWMVSRFADALREVIAECRRAREDESVAGEAAARARAGYELVVETLEARVLQAETEAAGLRAAIRRPEAGHGPEPLRPARGEAAESDSISALKLSVRVSNVLARAGVNTITQLAGMTEAQLLKLRFFGRTSLKEVIRCLASRGLRLRGDS